MANPVFHFEIPVTDMDRAVRFYEAVFQFPMRREQVDGYDMAFFPHGDGQPGASGALAWQRVDPSGRHMTESVPWNWSRS